MTMTATAFKSRCQIMSGWVSSNTFSNPMESEVSSLPGLQRACICVLTRCQMTDFSTPTSTSGWASRSSSKLGHKLREEADLRVRQPLAELRFACPDPQQRAAIERLADVIEEELNLKKLTSCDHLDDLVSYVYKPNQKALGPKYGKLLGAITQTLAATDPNTLAPLRRGESVVIGVRGQGLGASEDGEGSSLTPNPQPLTPITLLPTDIVITTQQAAEWVSTDERGVQIALSTHLTPDLLQEGIARDFVRQVQQLRKDADLEIQPRIKVCYSTDDADVLTALQSWGEYIRGETLADAVTLESTVPADVKPVTIGNAKLPIWIGTK